MKTWAYKRVLVCAVCSCVLVCARVCSCVLVGVKSPATVFLMHTPVPPFSNAHTCASSGVATSPVPIAHTGSYAMMTCFISSLLTPASPCKETERARAREAKRACVSACVRAGEFEQDGKRGREANRQETGTGRHPAGTGRQAKMIQTRTRPTDVM